jgi:hypothetical protein
VTWSKFEKPRTATGDGSHYNAKVVDTEFFANLLLLFCPTIAAVSTRTIISGGKCELSGH